MEQNKKATAVTTGNTYILRNIESFGDVAAEDDAVLDYFLTTDAVAKIKNGSTLLVLGRKGTGKTAIVRYFTERDGDILSKSLNLRGYPWNVHAQRVDRGASDIEAYVSSWRYLIAVELAALVLNVNEGQHHSKSRELEHFLKENYGGTQPQLADILRPQKLTLKGFSLKPAVMGNELGGVEMERSTKDYRFGLELNAVSSAIIAAVLEIAADRTLGPMSLHFDELDQGISELSEERKRMLVGLVVAAREIKRECEKIGGQVRPVIYLRTDFWDELQFSDKNKITQTLTLPLTWETDSLQRLVLERLRAKLDAKATWDDIIDNQLMRGSQPKWNHIVARTFSRPRDIIQFLNVSLAQAKARDPEAAQITNKDIVRSRTQYSPYLKAELDDEIRPHWQYWDEALKACSAISTLTFDRDEFVATYNSTKSKSNLIEASDALELLYKFSVIGYERRSGYGGSSWAFQYTDPEVGWDSRSTRFKVHLGLKEYAKLRETRQAGAALPDGDEDAEGE